MHSRCTPFGLFAGCGIMESGAEAIRVNLEEIERSTRLDMHFTCALAQKLAQLPDIQQHLKFYPNSSLYIVQDRIRYIEYYYRDKIRVHKISAVDSSIYLQGILQKARDGATLAELALTIVDGDITFEEASAFVAEIVSAQLLVSELEPGVTGEELLVEIINVLNSILNQDDINLQKKSPENSIQHQELQDIIGLLKNTQEQLQTIDKRICNDITVYSELAEKLRAVEVPFELNKLFQPICLSHLTKVEISQRFTLMKKIFKMNPMIMAVISNN